MFKLRTFIVVCAAMGQLWLANKAVAIDPFSIAAVVSAGASVVSTLSDAAGEVAGAADAFSELYSEFDSNAEVSHDASAISREIREIESLAREAGYTKEEISDLMGSRSGDLKRLTETLRHLTRVVRAGKRVAKLFTRLSQKAQLSQLEAVEIQKEQLKVQYRQLSETVKSRLAAKKHELQAQIERKNQIKLHRKEIQRRGGRYYPGTAIFTFPKADKVLKGALDFATGLRRPLIGLILLVFLVRVIFYQTGLFSSGKYRELFQDVAIAMLLLVAFPELIKCVLSVSKSISTTITPEYGGTLNEGFAWPQYSDWNLSKNTVLFVHWLFSWIKYMAFVLADFIFNWGLAFLVILFPVVIFSSFMLGFRFAWTLLLGTFIALCLWPFFWNMTGLLASKLWIVSGSYTDYMKTTLFSLLQFVSPFLGLALLRGPSVSAAATRVAVAAGTKGGSVLFGAVAGALGQSGGALAGRGMGVASRWGTLQLAGRTHASFSRGTHSYTRQKSQVSNDHNRFGPVREAAEGFLFNEPAAPIARPKTVLGKMSEVGIRSCRGLRGKSQGAKK